MWKPPVDYNIKEKMAKKDVKKKKERGKENEKSRGMIMIPYVKGLFESIAQVMKKRRITTAMCFHTTLRNLLVHVKCMGCLCYSERN